MRVLQGECFDWSVCHRFGRNHCGKCSISKKASGIITGGMQCGADGWGSLVPRLCLVTGDRWSYLYHGVMLLAISICLFILSIQQCTFDWLTQSVIFQHGMRKTGTPEVQCSFWCCIREDLPQQFLPGSWNMTGHYFAACYWRNA